MTTRMRGTILRVFLTKGYGFVMGEDNISRFMHVSAVDPPTAFSTMHEGQAVDFEPNENGPLEKGNGLRAEKVRIIQQGA